MSNTTNNALLIPADLNAACKSVHIPNRDLFEVSKIIGCEYVALVNVLPIIRQGIGMDTDLWVDDCGLLVERPVLNVRASIISGQRLYGNAILTGREMTDEGEAMADLKFRSCVVEFLNILQMAAESMVADGDAWTNPLKEEA